MSNATRPSLWLIAYDIADPARLRTAAQVLEDHGRRLQQSVFVCSLTNSALADLRTRLREGVDPAVDRLAFLPICSRCHDRFEQYGVPTPLPGSGEALIV